LEYRQEGKQIGGTAPSKEYAAYQAWSMRVPLTMGRKRILMPHKNLRQWLLATSHRASALILSIGGLSHSLLAPAFWLRQARKG
jgi:hypothetical protein